jgi:hypothetical protein
VFRNSLKLTGKLTGKARRCNSMRNDRIRSPEESAKVASTLVDVAEEQSEFVGKLLDQLKMALEEFDRRTIQLTRDMPNEIAQ